MSSPGCDL